MQPDLALNTSYEVDISVIVPTYKEAENLPVLVPRIAETLIAANLTAEIIVVDDDSPDKTVTVCADLASSYPLRLEVRRGERGLSSAVIHGMRLARGKVLVVLDADLSHPPEAIPDLVRALDDPKVDFVIGSRYTPGGGTAEDWGLFRWLNSKVATLLARPLVRAADPMAGFFALRRQSFESASNLDPVGYKIGLELIVKCGCKNIRELPIQFRNRLHGQSKLTLKEQWNYLRHLKRLYEYKLGRAALPVQFALVGSSGVVIDLAVFTLLLLTLSLPVARALAIWAAMTWNFWLNRRLTFSYSRNNPMVPQYLLFGASSLFGGIVSWGLSTYLPLQMGIFSEHVLAAALVGIVAGAVLNYLFSWLVAFGRDPSTIPITGRPSRVESGHGKGEMGISAPAPQGKTTTSRA